MEDKEYLDGEQFRRDMLDYCEKEFPKIVCTTKYFEQERIRMGLEKGQIKKAIECCATRDCDNCPYTDNKEMCFKISEAHTIIKVLLDRIEILEILNSVNDKVGEDYTTLHAAYTELARTCTTLVDKVKFWNEQYDALHIRNAVLADAIENYQSEIMVTRGEVERLTEENEGLRAKVMALNHHADQADAAIYALQHLFDTRADAVREMHSILYEEFLKVARIQKSGEPNMKSQEVFAILDQTKKEMLEGNDGTH